MATKTPVLVMLGRIVRQHSPAVLTSEMASASSMPNRTVLTPQEERRFQDFYSEVAAAGGLNPNPDAPQHQYDYRGAFKAKKWPQLDPEDMRYHWPSEFKDPGHPRRFINGVDTKSGKRRR